jgi:hypothetical protein
LFNLKELLMTTYKPSGYNELAERFRLTTEQFAAQHLVQPQTVRKMYAATGTYCGIAPLRLPNRRLLWPADSIARLVADAFGPEGKA